jgi:hypothetical protein
MCKGSKMLIINLMAMQLLLCGFFFPILNLNVYMAFRRIAFNLHCPILLMLHIGTMHAEIWASLLLAINRYIAIALPHYYKKCLSWNSLVTMIVLPWLIGVGNTVPLYFGIGMNFSMVRPYGYCDARVIEVVYGTIWVTIGAYIPMVLMGVVYLTLFIRLAIRRYKMQGQIEHLSGRKKPKSRLKSTKNERQISMATMLVVSYLWFCLCFLPGPVLATSFHLIYVQDFMLALWTTRTIIICGYAVSPVGELK